MMPEIRCVEIEKKGAATMNMNNNDDIQKMF